MPLGDGGWRLKVLDFGLAGRATGGNPIAGTLAYMAPELFSGRRATARSDIYAVGMVLAELLLGHHPFFGEQNEEAFIKRVQDVTPDLSGIGNAFLASVLSRALHKAPTKRPADAATFMRELAEAAELKLPRESEEVRDSYLIAAPFTGREGELGRLTGALNRTRMGHGSAWLIAGESGVGKSRLLDELRSLALVSSVLVCRGQAVSDAGSAYQLWRDVLRPICLSAELSELEASVLGTLLPDLPTLLEREGAPPPELDASASQARLVRVIVDLLARQLQPVLLLLEDLHWADAESVELLRHLSHSIAARRLMIVASAREEEAPNLPTELPQLQLLVLSRLSAANLRRLCESMLGPTGSDPDLLKLVQSETEGNAYFAVEVIRALAEESGSLEGIARQSLPARVLSGGIQQVLRRRLARVPQAARPLLRLGAVAGRQLDLGLLQHIWPDAEQLAQAGAAAGVLEVSEETWRFSHDKLREYILADMKPAESRALHALFAETLEGSRRSDGALSAKVAYHYREAQRFAEAAHHYALAGEAALLRGAPNEAATMLQQAAQLHEKSERPLIEKMRVWRGLAQATLALRRHTEIGDALRHCFRLLGHSLPEDRAGIIRASIWQVVRQLGLRARGLLRRPASVAAIDASRREVAQEMCEALSASQVYLWIGQIDFGFLCLIWRMNLAEEFNLVDQQFDLLVSVSGLLSLTPLRPVSGWLMEQAEKDLVHYSGTPAETAYLYARAFASNNEGAWRDGMQWMQRTIASSRLRGDELGLQRQLGTLLWSSCCGTDAATQQVILDEMAQRAKQIESRFYSLVAQTGRGLVYLIRGNASRAAEELTSAYEQSIREGMPQIRGTAGGLLAECFLRLGDPQRAQLQARQTLRGLAGVPLTVHHLTYGICAVVDVYLQVGEQQSRVPVPLRGALSLLRRLSERCQLVRPSFERSLARMHWLDGKKERAVHTLSRSLATARRFGHLREQGLAHYYLGRFASSEVGRSLIAEPARRHFESALEIFERIGELEYAGRTRKELA